MQILNRCILFHTLETNTYISPVFVGILHKIPNNLAVNTNDLPLGESNYFIDVGEVEISGRYQLYVIYHYLIQLKKNKILREFRYSIFIKHETSTLLFYSDSDLKTVFFSILFTTFKKKHVS